MTSQNTSCKGTALSNLSDSEINEHYLEMYSYSKLSFQNYLKSNVVNKKKWLTSGKENTCTVCKKNEDCGEIPLNKVFPSGHLFPPAGEGCRCTIVPIV